MFLFTDTQHTVRTSSRFALAAGFLLAAVHVGTAYAAVNPEPGGPGCQNAKACSDPVSGSADLARPADLAPNTPTDYRLVRLVDQAQAGAVRSELAALRR